LVEVVNILLHLFLSELGHESDKDEGTDHIDKYQRMVLSVHAYKGEECSTVNATHQRPEQHYSIYIIFYL